jgi:hypothetical protein
MALVDARCLDIMMLSIESAWPRFVYASIRLRSGMPQAVHCASSNLASPVAGDAHFLKKSCAVWIERAWLTDPCAPEIPRR